MLVISATGYSKGGNPVDVRASHYNPAKLSRRWRTLRASLARQTARRASQVKTAIERALANISRNPDAPPKIGGKLTAPMVYDVRDMVDRDCHSLAEIASKHSISRQCVFAIGKRRIWAWLPEREVRVAS